MSELLQEPTLNQLMLFAEAFPVSRTPSLASVADRTTNAICGPSSPELFASLGLGGWSQRTCQGFYPQRLDGSLAPFSETWPRAGMTRNGTAYRLPPSAPLTAEIESGSWPTLDASPHKYRFRGSSQQSKSLNGIHGGQLNPLWAEWLMGYPLGWTGLPDWATRSFRRSRNGSHGRSRRQKGTDALCVDRRGVSQQRV